MIQAGSDAFRVGVSVVVLAVFFGLAVISVLEAWCELAGVPSLSYRVEVWAQNKPWFAYALILLWATLLSHFFLNALPPPPSAQ